NQVTGPRATVTCHNYAYSIASKTKSMNPSTNGLRTAKGSATSGNFGTREMNSISGYITFSANSSNIRANANSTHNNYNRRFNSDIASSLNSRIDSNDVDQSHLPDRHGYHIASRSMDNGAKDASRSFQISAVFFLTYLLTEETDTMDGATTDDGDNDGFSSSFDHRAGNSIDNLRGSISYSFDLDDPVSDSRRDYPYATTPPSEKFVVGMDETMRNMVYVSRSDAIDFQSRGLQTVTTMSKLKVDKNGAPIISPGSVVC
ncbi:hypothetical protein BGZ95_002505, partial [Linnemannia exigua]